jgi:hypothetical protein
MVMDDIGSVFWRFGKKLLATGGETGHPPTGHRNEPPTIVRSPAAE